MLGSHARRKGLDFAKQLGLPLLDQFLLLTGSLRFLPLLFDGVGRGVVNALL